MIVLAYRPQPVPVSGRAVVLDYAAAATVAGGGPVRATCRAPWARSQAGRRDIVARFDGARFDGSSTAGVTDCPHRAPWPASPPAHAVARPLRAAWPPPGMAGQSARAAWSPAGRPLAAPRCAPWGSARTADPATRAPWARYAVITARPHPAGWGVARQADPATHSPWARHALAVDSDYRAPTPAARQADPATRAPWGTFRRRLAAGWGIVTPDSTHPTDPTDPHGTRIVPILRAYIVTNDLSLIRVSNSLELPALSLSISADVDSWTYQWSASLPADRIDDIFPAAPGEPVELEAGINGWPHRLLVERVALDRTHAKPRIQIGGRGLAARLAAPYAASEARDNTAGARTAGQLCEDALLLNGVPASGWAVDFALDDWLVPAGAWVTQGTPLEAIDAIAVAAGGYLRPDPTAQVLHISPRYPVAPWDWATATPDYELPAEATTKIGIEWKDAPPYNAVYIAGTGVGGILGHIKRAGTAGDLTAPLVTDPLITAVAAARQRGLALLGSAGRGQTLTIETPIFAGIGPYPVGSLLRFVDGGTARLGLVRRAIASNRECHCR